MLQLPPPQWAQPPPPPAIGTVVPNSLLERQTNLDKALLEGCLHIGQSAGSLDLLIGRINSNFVWQSGQTYSYIGISVPHLYFNDSVKSRQPSQTIFPPITVICTFISFIASGDTRVGLLLIRTKSASLPVAIEPLMFSSWDA